MLAINGGYFAFGSGPVSYSKGHLGYESPSGNVKGPRACLIYDRQTGEARIELSMGREYSNGSWGAGLYPDADDVICAGPTLVKDDANVFWEQYEAESFETSGISPESPYPRSALCIKDDGGILLLAAQSHTVKARGFSLPELADYLVSRGCRDAMNLDGGGSTAMWWVGPPVDYEPGTEDRSVYNAILLRELE